jgi:hypothetical protein
MTSNRYGQYGSSLRDLPRLRLGRRGRLSSWDRTGGNHDFVVIDPGETLELGRITGAGSITHMWYTTKLVCDDPYNHDEPDYLRKLVLRMFWDGEDEPSVFVPLGDFFGAMPPEGKAFASSPLQVGPSAGRSLTSFWHMPFGSEARISLENESSLHQVNVYFYVDFEEFDELEDDLGRFHAQWRRENPCDGESLEQGRTNLEHLESGHNLTGKGNYTILEAEGQGHYVGCILSITNLRESAQWNWYGEGDDMIFVDRDSWPPTLHGTGTEDYFDSAYCPAEPQSTPYHGIISAGGWNWSGTSTLYRFHIEDPIAFRERIRVTIEHGHANSRSDDYVSVAYWYQREPHVPFALPSPMSRELDGRAA